MRSAIPHSSPQPNGKKEDAMRVRDHEKEELSFYSKATTDIEYLFPFGWGELWGIAGPPATPDNHNTAR